jgi:hypothetical protein
MGNFRKVDWGILLTLLTLLGVIWQAYAKPAQWDQTVKEMADIRPKVYEHDKQLAVIIERLDEMNLHLAAIDKHTR